jgi:metal-responsive CopG/Arc/MetJ family transcriptional regulator
MQTLIDIPEEDLTQLDQLSETRNVPREEIIRAAVSSYLRSHKDALEQSFGIWAGRNGDGVEYQRRMRGE